MSSVLLNVIIYQFKLTFLVKNIYPVNNNISQSRTKLEKRRDSMALTVSLCALIVALASVIIVVVSKFF